jgi:activating signal cointegrator 1
MKAISIRQPWTWLIMQGFKRYETRSWKTNHRGPILICAAKHKMSLAEREEMMSHNHALGCLIDEYEQMPFGKAVCVATLSECIATEDLWFVDYVTEIHLGDFSSGRFAFLLTDIRPIKPFPLSGALGIFNAPVDLTQIEFDEDV